MTIWQTCIIMDYSKKNFSNGEGRRSKKGGPKPNIFLLDSSVYLTAFPAA